mmetsp:Transcript_31948/g.43623  ORF Transcript_31948/g.43623 Transcript_31948/m.43623 type:complete len:273 (+) Transcript_31948:63-881(+)
MIFTTLAVLIANLIVVSSFGTTSNNVLCEKSRVSNDKISMKIFDWKKRQEFENFQVPDDYVLSVNTISAIPGSRKKFLRVGRGISAGQGKTCGRGMRGQKSRKGNGKGVRAGFEGGQTALYRRLPKFVGKPHKGHTKTVYELIKLEMLNSFEDNSEVDFAQLLEKGIATKANKSRDIFKVVGGSNFGLEEEGVGSVLKAKNLVVKAHAFTESARAAIEAAGGTCVVLSPTRHIPLEQAQAEKAVVVAGNLVRLKELRALKAKRDQAKELAKV